MPTEKPCCASSICKITMFYTWKKIITQPSSVRGLLKTPITNISQELGPCIHGSFIPFLQTLRGPFMMDQDFETVQATE